MAWTLKRFPWCNACQAAGVPLAEPLWSPEDWPDTIERAWCVAQVEEADRLWSARDGAGAWQALEAVYVKAEKRDTIREPAALEERLIPTAESRNDWHYVIKLRRRQRAWYRELGDTA